MKSLSQNAKNIEGQPMFKLKERIAQLEHAGQRVIRLEIGDPDFNTPSNIISAAKTSLDAGETHYTSSWGLPDFLRAVADATHRSRGFRPSRSQILATPGANVTIFYSVFCLANSGEEILMPDPGFPTYESSIKMCGTVPVRYPIRESEGFQVRAANIEPLITDETRLLIINTPGNPTGTVTPEHHLRDLYDLAVDKDLYVLSDEIYSRMIYEEADFFSISEIDQCKERVILSNGFSKAFAMTGWRLGSIIAPDEVAERMMLLLQTTSSCVSPFVQRAGIEAIEGDQREVNSMMAEFKARRNLLVNGLNSIRGISCHLPGGAFYAFANISSFGLSAQEFADLVLEEGGVALLPGSNFGAQGEGFVRLCYAASREDIAEALERIAEVCKGLGGTQV